MQPNKARADLWMDLALVAFLIGFDVVARLVPHAPGFLPIAASALFAGRMLRIPAFAPVVPVAAMVLSALALGPDDWRISLVVTVAISLPALVGIVSRRWPGIAAMAAVMVPCSLVFFAVSNFAVWAFSGMYSLDFAGPDPVLRRGTAVPAEYGGGRSVLDRGAVRRRLGHPKRGHAGGPRALSAI